MKTGWGPTATCGAGCNDVGCGSATGDATRDNDDDDGKLKGQPGKVRMKGERDVF